MFPVPGQIHLQWKSQPMEKVDEDKGKYIVDAEKVLRAEDLQLCGHCHQDEYSLQAGIDRPAGDVGGVCAQVDQVSSELADTAHFPVGADALEEDGHLGGEVSVDDFAKNWEDQRSYSSTQSALLFCVKRPLKTHPCLDCLREGAIIDRLDGIVDDEDEEEGQGDGPVEMLEQGKVRSSLSDKSTFSKPVAENL